MVTYDEIARMIDHSLLNPTPTDREIRQGCELAAKDKVASVAFGRRTSGRRKKFWKGTGVIVTTVIGFPHGTTTTGKWPRQTRHSTTGQSSSTAIPIYTDGRAAASTE